MTLPSFLNPFDSTPWYKTWWGIGGLAIGGIAILALLRPRGGDRVIIVRK